MFLVSKNEYANILENYKKDITFTPNLACVLANIQEGYVYKLNSTGNDCFLLHNRSGYAQVIGDFTEDLQDELQSYLLSKQFNTKIFRLYNANINSFHTKFEKKYQETRQRFKLESLDKINEIDLSKSKAYIAPVSMHNFEKVYSTFSTLFRFWKDKEDFLLNSRALACFYNNDVVSLCYASSVACGIVDINIMTNENYRKQGFAKTAVVSFIRNCYNDGLEVIWDCYYENVGSMALNKSLGFTPKYEPYAFVEISKD